MHDVVLLVCGIFFGHVMVIVESGIILWFLERRERNGGDDA